MTPLEDIIQRLKNRDYLVLVNGLSSLSSLNEARIAEAFSRGVRGGEDVVKTAYEKAVETAEGILFEENRLFGLDKEGRLR